MQQPLLTAYWIVSTSRRDGPLGFGVTAWSLGDAIRILRWAGYGQFIPDDLSTLSILENVAVADLDQPHVVANMGPIVVRGVWYPFIALGVPAEV